MLYFILTHDTTAAESAFFELCEQLSELLHGLI